MYDAERVMFRRILDNAERWMASRGSTTGEEWGALERLRNLFTHEDVAFLRTFTEVTRGASGLAHLPERDRYASLANRIDSLLSPEQRSSNG